MQAIPSRVRYHSICRALPCRRRIQRYRSAALYLLVPSSTSYSASATVAKGRERPTDFLGRLCSWRGELTALPDRFTGIPWACKSV